MNSRRPATGAMVRQRAPDVGRNLQGRDRFWRLALVALTLTLVLETARVLFPILFDFGEEEGQFLLAGGLAVIIFLGPLLTPPLLRSLGVRRGLVLSIVVLVALRLLMQLIHPVTFGIAAGATVTGLVAVTVELVAFRSLGTDGNRDLVLGVLFGLPIDAALRGAFLGWDHTWQAGLVPLLVTASLGAAVVASAGAVLPRLTPRRETSIGHLLPLILVGPYLMLQVLLFQNLGFVSTSTGLSLPGSTALVLGSGALALLVAGWLWGRSVPLSVGILAGVLFPVVAYLLRETTGVVVASLIVAGHAVGAALLTLAVDRPIRESRRSAWRTSAAFAVGSLAFALLLVLYQIHYVVPLPFTNRAVPTFAAALVALGGLRRRIPAVSGRPGRSVRIAALPLALLIVPAVAQLTSSPVPPVAESSPAFRLVDFNVRLAVNVDGQVDPEGTAKAIEGQRPDVVLLQEVGRGWPINGTLDLAEWLSRRLRMPYLFAPAADGQFGNAIFTRLPILRTESGFLPFGAGPQRRSYLLAQLDLGDGRSVSVVSVHLQNAEGTDTRRDQIRSLLAWVGGGLRTIVAGDMNMQPDQADLTLFQDAGLVSVQDQAGLGQVSTASRPKVFPVDRVNWIFATPDLAFSDFAVVPSDASDHLPLAVTVTV